MKHFFKLITFLYSSSLVAQSHTAVFNISFWHQNYFTMVPILHLSRTLFQTVNRLRNATVLDAVISCRSTAFATIADCGRINIISNNVLLIISTLIPQCRCRLLSPLLIPVEACNCRVGCRDHHPHSSLKASVQFYFWARWSSKSNCVICSAVCDDVPGLTSPGFSTNAYSWPEWRHRVAPLHKMMQHGAIPGNVEAARTYRC